MPVEHAAALRRCDDTVTDLFFQLMSARCTPWGAPPAGSSYRLVEVVDPGSVVAGRIVEVVEPEPGVPPVELVVPPG